MNENHPATDRHAPTQSQCGVDLVVRRVNKWSFCFQRKSRREYFSLVEFVELWLNDFLITETNWNPNKTKSYWKQSENLNIMSAFVPNLVLNHCHYCQLFIAFYLSVLEKQRPWKGPHVNILGIQPVEGEYSNHHVEILYVHFFLKMKSQPLLWSEICKR